MSIPLQTDYLLCTNILAPPDLNMKYVFPVVHITPNDFLDNDCFLTMDLLK